MAINPQEVELILIHAIRDYAVAAQLRMLGITGQHFSGTPYEYLAPVWEGLLSYMNQGFTTLPSYDVMVNLVSRRIHGGLPPQWISYYGEFIKRAFALPEADLRPLYILAPAGPLRELVVELRVAPMLRLAASETDPAELEKALIKVEQVRQETVVSGARTVDIMDPTNIVNFTAPAVIDPTGLDYWDRSIGGLQQVCAVGVLAVTGGGKTTFGVDMMVESIIAGKNVAFFAYEQQIEGDLVSRIYRRVLGMSRSEAEKTGYTPQVISRLQQVRPSVDRYMKLFPMAGDMENQGTGGPGEIEAIIRDCISRYNWKPDLIIIDWLEPVLRRWLGVAQTGVSDYQKQLKYVLDAIKQIRDVFGIKVIILHQLAAAQAEKMTPAQVPSHHMAAEVKSFADLLNASCAFGKVDPDTMCMHAAWTKCRWHKPINTVVKLDAENDRIIGCSDIELNPDWRAVGESTFRKRRVHENASA